MKYLTSEALSIGAQSALITAAVRGALNVDASESGATIRRLPGWTRAQYGDAWTIDTVSSILSGVHLEFETAASWIELEMTFTRPVAAAIKVDSMESAVAGGDKPPALELSNSTPVPL